MHSQSVCVTPYPVIFSASLYLRPHPHCFVGITLVFFKTISTHESERAFTWFLDCVEQSTEPFHVFVRVDIFTGVLFPSRVEIRCFFFFFRSLRESAKPQNKCQAAKGSGRVARDYHYYYFFVSLVLSASFSSFTLA